MKQGIKRWAATLITTGLVATGLVAGQSLPAQATTYTVVAAGDIAKHPTSDGDISSGSQSTALLVRSLSPGKVLVAGDSQYNAGSLTEYQQGFDHVWGANPWDSGTSFYSKLKPAPGDHDWDTANAQGFLDYYGRTKTWNSWDYGGFHFIQLDSHEWDNATQITFLQNDWDDNQAGANLPVIAYFSHPRFSSGDQHGSDGNMDAFWQILYDGGSQQTKLIINGHEHVYERFGCMTPGGSLSAAHGIRQITVGTGGAANYGFNAPITGSQQRYTAESDEDDGDAYDNLNRSLETAHGSDFAETGKGVLKLTLDSTNPGVVSWSFYSTDTGISGVTQPIDSGTSC